MKFRDYITEQLFNIDSADKIARELESNIKAPFVKAQKSTLGGNVSVIMRLSLDPKNEWYNNIFENSRFMHFHFSKSSKIKTKFRKIIVDNIKIAIKKINDYLIKVEAEG